MTAKHIGIYTGFAYENWDLDTYKNLGLGGAETCAGRLAQTAVEQGHEVTLYGNFNVKKPNNKQYGVELVHWKNFNPTKKHFDLFISSRVLDPIDENLQAEKVLVWLHDIRLLTEKGLTDFQKNKINKFIALSPSHKNFLKDYYKMDENFIEIIPPGVNTELFEPFNFERKEFGKLIWTSSPDRGLENLLHLIPLIKAQVPELQLDVTYGFYNWLSHAIRKQDESAIGKIDKLKSLMSSYDYIHYRGRMNQAELAKNWGTAYLWLYPTRFCETYCISAKEGQVSGTPLLCSGVGALRSTVGSHGIVVNEDAYSEDGREKFVAHAVEILKNKDLWHELSAKSLAGAKNVSWTDRWHEYWQKWL